MKAKFVDIAKAIEDSITDEADKSKVTPAATFDRMNKILDWNLSGEELQYTKKAVDWTAVRIQLLPIRTRQLLSVIISRLHRIQRKNGYGYDYDVPHAEIVEASGQPDRVVIDHVNIMERYGIAIGEDADEGRPPTISLREYPKGGFFWGDFREFCTRAGIPLEALIVDLRFDLLD